MVPDGVDVEPHPEGFVVGAEGEKAANLIEDVSLLNVTAGQVAPNGQGPAAPSRAATSESKRGPAVGLSAARRLHTR